MGIRTRNKISIREKLDWIFVLNCEDCNESTIIYKNVQYYPSGPLSLVNNSKTSKLGFRIRELKIDKEFAKECFECQGLNEYDDKSRKWLNCKLLKAELVYCPNKNDKDVLIIEKGSEIVANYDGTV